ncbi:hypothetical protein ACIPUC_15025 [Streptomyces sp. LARHCF249]
MVRQLTEMFRSADEELGGGHGLTTVTTYLTDTVAPMLAARFPSAAVRKDAFGAAAQLACLAGWKHHDLGRDGEAGRARALAEADLCEGPPALEPETVDTKRYGLTDALDDLADAGDPIERLAVAGYVVNAAADLLCDHHHAWIGGGKWLPRRLLEADPQRGAALLAGHHHLCGSGEPAALISAASKVLDLVGGPLREGYRRTWHGTNDSVAPTD